MDKMIFINKIKTLFPTMKISIVEYENPILSYLITILTNNGEYLISYSTEQKYGLYIPKSEKDELMVNSLPDEVFIEEQDIINRIAQLVYQPQ